MEMAVKNWCEGSQHASEYVHKEEGHRSICRYVSTKRMKNFLTFGPHRMLPKLLSLLFLLLTMTTRTRLKQSKTEFP